ncbi:MAG: putative sialidase [Verrucomicrobiales bacterium]|nr:putative sialidase [Verrucomicrobiales bacterium]
MKHHQLLGSAAFVAAVCVASGSADYGPAIWDPACSGHWYTSGSGHKFHVIHDMEGYYASTISYFKNCNTTASVHYCVNGKADASSDAAAGEVTQMVSESYYAWHARCWNTHCTGTEHEGFASNPAWYTEAMYQSSAGITRHVSDRFNWPEDRNHVVGHGEGQNSAWRTYASANLGIDPTCNSHTDPGPNWNWSHYMGLVQGGGTPGAVSWASGRIDTFTRGADGALKHKWYSAGWSSGWEDLGGGIIGGPAAASWGAGHLDVFVRGTDSAIYQKTYDAGSGWSGFTRFAGTMTSDPAVVAWGVNRLDVFARGTDGSLQHMWFDGTWHPWQSLGGTIIGGPTVSSWGAGRLDVFARGGNSECYHIYYDAGWGPWTSLAGGFNSDFGAVSWGPGRIDVFGRGTSNELYHKYFSGGAWAASWENLGGGLLSGPDVSTWGVNRLDVFIRGNNNALYTKYWDGTGWSGYNSLGAMP